MTLVSTVTLATTSQLDITSIPQTGKDLLLLFSGRVDNTNKDAALRFNGDSNANYSARRLEGDGSNATTTSEPGQSFIRVLNNQSGFTSNSFTNAGIYISSYTNSSNKYVNIDDITETNATLSYQRITGGIYSTSSPITSISIVASLVAGSTASLYIIS